MTEHAQTTVIQFNPIWRNIQLELKYVSSTNLVAHTENCKLDIPLNCSVKELERTLIRMCGVENFGTGILTKKLAGKWDLGKILGGKWDL